VTALVFVPMHNVHGKRDAEEFLREAHRFNHVHGIRDVHIFDNKSPMVRRRDTLFRQLPDVEPGTLETLALFCHGWEDGVQLGFNRRLVRDLVKRLKPACAPKLTVALYCCSTGMDDDGTTADERAPGPGGDGGFADRLRDALCDAGIAATVFAHSTPGHTTQNPYVRVFAPDRRNGGEWLIEPGSELWPYWRRSLQTTDLRFKFPFVSREAVEGLLRGGKP
jgi:hypothetical protein